MPAVVFTDLDGTLLDHHSYSFAAALPALNKLASHAIPLVPVTSKTQAELEPLRQALGLETPFIVENGAAVFIPDSNPLFDTRECELRAGYAVKNFADDIDFWAEFTASLARQIPGAFTPFSQLSLAQIASLTGLSESAAQLAKQRQFSDPLHWYGSDADLKQVREHCAAASISVVRGGRFVHLTRGASKGTAVRWCLQHYAAADRPVSIALGDGENDLSMLAEVDFPVQIKPASGDFPVFAKAGLIRTEEPGPQGWSAAISELLQHKISY